MSPAYTPAEGDIFSWVGIIMYLPTMDARQRKQITEKFFHYRHLTYARLWDHYAAFEHWAKIEVPKDKEELATLLARLRKKFPLDTYNKAQREMDPNHILSNNMLEKLFPLCLIQFDDYSFVVSYHFCPLIWIFWKYRCITPCFMLLCVPHPS